MEKRRRFFRLRNNSEELRDNWVNFNFKQENLLFLCNSEKNNLTIGQVRKSVGRMTWHQEPKKDVTSCDKLRGEANIH